MTVRNTQILASKQTCYGCPEQYEGKLTDGRWFYFRYRWGYASLAVGDDHDAVMGRQDVGMGVGDGLQGIFDSPEQRDRVFGELLAEVADAAPDRSEPGA